MTTDTDPDARCCGTCRYLRSLAPTERDGQCMAPVPKYVSQQAAHLPCGNWCMKSYGTDCPTWQPKDASDVNNPEPLSNAEDAHYA